MKYKFFEDVAIADICFEAYGKDLCELFENSALALESVMVDLNSLRRIIKRVIVFKKKTLKDLLFAFLEELVFLKDAEQLLFCWVKCEVIKKGHFWELKSFLEGQNLGERVKLGVDVKAVTRHLYTVGKKDNLYFSRVVLDI